MLVLACGGDPPPGDAGPGDTGPSDTGTADTGMRDVGPGDAGNDAFVEDVGTDAFVEDAGTDASTWCVGPPGLYVEASCTDLAPGVSAYHPRYALWSDGDDKERFVYLPPGTQIDTSDPDRWGFPVGTRLYKTFSIGGVRIETRILEKIAAPRGPASWTMTAYAWSADQQSVHLVSAFGERDVLGTGHDVPSLMECIRCHSIAQDDVINGFSAIQLAHDEGGVTLASLNADGWLSAAIDPADATIPGSASDQAALGYLHANCGSCHGGPTPEHGLDYWVRVGTPDVPSTTTWTTSVCSCSVWTGLNASGDFVDLRIAPAHPELSVATVRMSTRVAMDQMPPIGTAVVDDAGLALISDWIATLDPTANGCPHGCPWP